MILKIKEFINNLTKKQKALLLVGMGLIVVVLLIISSTGGLPTSSSPFSTGNEIPKGLARVNISTNPAGAVTFLGEYIIEGVSPNQINEIAPGDYVIRAEKLGYYIVEQKVTVVEGENKFLVPLERVPALYSTYRNRLMLEPRLIEGGGPKPYAIHMNPRRRTLEAYDGQNVILFDYTKLKDLNEIHWFNSTKALVVTGNTKDEKKDYIVDFTNITDITIQKPLIRRVPEPGFMYTWSLDGNTLGVFGDSNYDTGQSSLLTQVMSDRPTAKVRLGTELFTGAIELEWLSDGTFLYVKETEGSGVSVNDVDRTDLLIIAPESTEPNANWKETLLQDFLGSRPVLSNDKSLVVYSAEGVLYLYDVATKQKTDLGSMAQFGGNLGYTMYGNSAIQLVTYSEDVGMTFYIIDFVTNAVHSYVSEIGIPNGVIQQVHRDLQGNTIVNFTSGDTYVFIPAF